VRKEKPVRDVLVISPEYNAGVKGRFHTTDSELTGEKRYNVFWSLTMTVLSQNCSRAKIEIFKK
jgi:hypothetical protein